MTVSWRSICWLILKLGILFLFLGPFIDSANALDELFETYTAPQALGMGNAFTADAYGYAALFHNPAGLAKGESRHWEVTPIALEMVPGFSGAGAAISSKSLGVRQLSAQAAANTNQYTYMRANVVPSVSYHGFALALLGSYQFAGEFDGTNLDVNSITDVGVVVGKGVNFFGNLVKVGIAAKAIDRNQLQGLFVPSSFTSDQYVATLEKEGIGLGADLGTMVTLPNKYLPTFGVVWKDMFNTYFHSSHWLNPHNAGIPDPIQQSVNAALAIHPAFGARVKATFAFEYQHLEMPSLTWQKHIHFGIQLITDKSWYLWLGINQLYPTGGLALRVKGGNLELGTYAEDVGYGNNRVSDRRIFFRYTIGF